MRAKITVASLVLVLALGMTVACSKSGPNDAQIIGQVATKIQADGNVQTKAIAIQSNSGVVTLSGQVTSDSERNAAAVDAAQVEGVKTVVNNLTVANAAASPEPVPQPVHEQAKPEPVKSSARHRDTFKTRKTQDNDRPAPAPTSTVAQNTPAPAPVSTYTPPPAPPKPQTVTVPDGTQISIRLIDPLDSEKNQVGDRFRATIGHSVYVGDQVVIPMGADVEGRVIDVKGATHFSGKSELAVELTNLSMGGKNYELHTQEYRREGAARGKNTAEKVGGGAAVGAILGGILGGGKGAAIGAAAGAGAGGGVNAATKGQKIQLPVESVLNFQLASPLTVTPNAKAGHSYNDRPVLSDRTNSGNNNSNDNEYSDRDSTDRPVLERRSGNSNNGDSQPN